MNSDQLGIPQHQDAVRVEATVMGPGAALVTGASANASADTMVMNMLF